MQSRCASSGRRWAAWSVAALVVAAAVGRAAAADVAPAGGGAPAAAAAQPPIHISAQDAEYFNKESRVVFTGSVVAVQGDSTLTSDRMEVVFSEPAPGAGSGVGQPASDRRITQLTALGNVTFRQVNPETKAERFTTGEKGVYDAAARQMTMTGNPRFWEGKNVIAGEQMVFFLDDNRVNVRGKVNVTVYPDETKGERTP